jgi:50S ribosomal subunit-associated GTPase HflX
MLDEDAKFVSSQEKLGIEQLSSAIDTILQGECKLSNYLIPHDEYSLVARMRKEGCLMTEEVCEAGVKVEGTPQGKLLHDLQKYSEK